ncbi:protein of unknown function [Ralstonia solanacearum CMR15]|nr:protein of unknown function [Ralstonia solanacearum CMR15]
MKRISYHRKTLLDRWSREATRNSSIRTPRIRRALLGARPVVVHAPVHFRVYENDNRVALLSFIKQVDAMLVAGGRVKIDFGKTKQLHPCGTLVFLAHLTLWEALHPNRLQATYPADDVVEQMLQHFNVLQRLGLSSRKQITDDRVKFWRHFTGSNVSAEIYKELTQLVLENIEHPTQQLFADCLNEAVTNVVNHAYEFEQSSLPPRRVRNWWMISQAKDGNMFVAIYDLGVTIPESLRRRPEWRDYLKGRSFSDRKLVKVAVASSRTSTKLAYRGKGFPEMLEFSRKLAAGGLSILSKKGGFVYDARAAIESSPKFQCSLPGTLVLWAIPFRKGQQNEQSHDLDR